MKKTLVSFLLIILFAFAGCQEQESVVESDTHNNKALAKQSIVWQYLPNTAWPKSDIAILHWDGCWYYRLSDQSFSFSYGGYNYEFTCNLGDYHIEYYEITVKVNNSQVGVLNNSNDFALDFTYDGKNMFAHVTVYQYSVQNICDDNNLVNPCYPNSAYVGIENVVYVAPDAPTGLTSTPLRPDYNSDLTLTWNASTDTDVTGYQIYRKLQTETGYHLIQTIYSRTTSTWVDTNVPWSAVSPLMEAVSYFIKAYDGTHNLYSDWSNVRICAIP